MGHFQFFGLRPPMLILINYRRSPLPLFTGTALSRYAKSFYIFIAKSPVTNQQQPPPPPPSIPGKQHFNCMMGGGWH